MELEQEVANLREACRKFDVFAGDLKKHLQSLYKPGNRPRPEVLIGLSLLATREGLPRRCSDRSCRRDGKCHATTIGEHPCAELWTPEMLERLEWMATGIGLSAICDEIDRAAIHSHLTRSLEASEPKPATGRRKKRSA